MGTSNVPSPALICSFSPGTHQRGLLVFSQNKAEPPKPGS